jgi:hypothetical protein
MCDDDDAIDEADDDDDDEHVVRILSIPSVCTFSNILIDRSFAFFSKIIAALSLVCALCSCAPVIFFFNIPALDVKNDVSDTTDS